MSYTPKQITKNSTTKQWEVYLLETAYVHRNMLSRRKAVVHGLYPCIREKIQYLSMKVSYEVQQEISSVRFCQSEYSAELKAIRTNS